MQTSINGTTQFYENKYFGDKETTPDCPRPIIALQVQNHGLKHQLFHLHGNVRGYEVKMTF